MVLFETKKTAVKQLALQRFFFHRELRPMKKTLREDAHSREAKNCRKRPRETPECAKAHSFLLPKIRGVKITCVILGNPVKYGQKIT